MEKSRVSLRQLENDVVLEGQENPKQQREDEGYHCKSLSDTVYSFILIPALILIRFGSFGLGRLLAP